MCSPSFVARSTRAAVDGNGSLGANTPTVMVSACAAPATSASTRSALLAIDALLGLDPLGELREPNAELARAAPGVERLPLVALALVRDAEIDERLGDPRRDLVELE